MCPTLLLSLFLYSCCFLTGGSFCSHLLTLVTRSRIFLPWRWRRYVPPRRRLTHDLHSATSQKTTLFIFTSVKTSDLTYFRMAGQWRSNVNDYDVTVKFFNDCGPVAEVCGSDYVQDEQKGVNDSHSSESAVRWRMLLSANIMRGTGSDDLEGSFSADIELDTFNSIIYCHV
jgi:hypothetical protein